MKRYRLTIILLTLVLVLIFANCILFVNRTNTWSNDIFGNNIYLLFNRNIVNTDFYKIYSGNIKSIKLTNDVLELNIYPLEGLSVNTNTVIDLKLKVKAESALLGVDRNIITTDNSTFYTNSFVQVKVTELNSKLEGTLLKELSIFSSL